MDLINGKVLDRNLETEMRESYIDYSMSVIVGRALPDVRDGLKPVHEGCFTQCLNRGLPLTNRIKNVPELLVMSWVNITRMVIVLSMML